MPPAARLTHFLCIPLVTPSSKPQLRKSLTAFRDDVTSLRTPEVPNGISEKAVRPLGTLHLTLGVMSLLTPERVASAVKLLRELNLSQILSESNPVLQKGQVNKADAERGGTLKQLPENLPGAFAEISVTLKGLTSMHNPSKTSILYASPEGSDLRLYLFCQKLRDMFIAADLLVKETRPLLLHATIVNTIYVPGTRGKGSGHGRSRARLIIDAREIIKSYEDFEWMVDVKIEKIAICRMGAQQLENGEEEYVIESEVEMP